MASATVMYFVETVMKRMAMMITTFKSLVYSNISSPITGLAWPRGFQEVKVPRLHDNGTGWW